MTDTVQPNGALTLDLLFRLGDHILIDKSCTGWILEKYMVDNEITFKIEYDLTTFIEESVTLDRIEVINIPNINTGICTSTSTRVQSDNSVSDRIVHTDITNQTSDHPLLSYFHNVLCKAFSFKKYKESTNMRLFTFLKEGSTKSKG